jgi:hypothetical protein
MTDLPSDYEIVHNGGMTYSVVLYKGKAVLQCDSDGAMEWVLEKLGVSTEQDEERFNEVYEPPKQYWVGMNIHKRVSELPIGTILERRADKYQWENTDQGYVCLSYKTPFHFSHREMMSGPGIFIKSLPE